jgi:hypothetical protein
MSESPRLLKKKARAEALTQNILKLLGDIPKSHQATASDPAQRAAALVATASQQAGLVSGGLALVPGAAGWLTILPELYKVWKIQAQLVADIAAIYGKTALLDREQMLWCLFKQAMSQVAADVVVQVGQRVLVRRATLRALQNIVAKIGVKVTQKLIGRVISRWVPLIGAAGVGAYAFFDTRKVGRNAVEIFSRDIVVSESCAK